jgi:hypothetical protein
VEEVIEDEEDISARESTKGKWAAVRDLCALAVNTSSPFSPLRQWGQ